MKVPGTQRNKVHAIDFWLENFLQQSNISQGLKEAWECGRMKDLSNHNRTLVRIFSLFVSFLCCTLHYCFVLLV